MNNTTFDTLPSAMDYIIRELADIKLKLDNFHTQGEVTSHTPIDIKEACKIIKKAKPTIYTLARKGLIPHYKVGNKLYFYENELLEWINQGCRKTISKTVEEVETEMIASITHKPKRRSFY